MTNRFNDVSARAGRRLFFQFVCLACLLVFVLPASLGPPLLAAEPAVSEYVDYPALTETLQALVKANGDLAALESLGKTAGGRDVWLLTLSRGDASKKPAILILGGVDASNLVGDELAVRMARRIIEEAKGSAGKDAKSNSAARLLDHVTLYIIPRPSPDASERFFQKPYAANATNERPTDDDRDGKTNEDPPDDLNGDGWITMMRVEDPTGEYLEHPDDPRVLIRADPKKKNERGRWRLYSEGVDNDGDQRWNEDPAGGVDLNRNFTFAYPYFQAGAGPNQVSEPETRAVADFAYSRPNLTAVFCFAPQDNLNHNWKADSRAERARIKKSLRVADAPYLDYLADKYRRIRGDKNAPASDGAAGDLVHWAYFHLGRWSLASRGWWIPEVSEKDVEAAREKRAKAKEEADAKRGDSSGDKDGKPARDKADEKKESPSDESPKKKPSGEKRGASDINALRWFEQQDINGFVPWTKIDHPDFPGQVVEVGGFKPFLREHPPIAVLDSVAEKHVKFLAKLDALRPKLALDAPKVESLGEGVYRVTATLRNDGYLPTMSAMGATSGQLQTLQMELDLPDGKTLVFGESRVRVGVLAGGGGKKEQVWLLSTGEAKANDAEEEKKKKEEKITLRAWSPSVGEARVSFELK